MNSNRATLAIVALLLLGAIFYQNKRTRELQASLASLRADREHLNRQLKNLTNVVADLKTRRTAPASAVEVASPTTTAPVAPPAPVRQREEPVETPGVTIKAPAGWWKNGSKPDAYVVGVDRTQTFGGMPSAYVKSLEPNIDGFGGMMQMSSAENFLGKRVRVSGWVKTQDANDGGGHLWLRVDGQQQGQSLQFDNMHNRAVKGTTEWQHHSVVLDVPADAKALAYGFFVEGAGQMWVSGAKIEEVGTEIPTTNMLKQGGRTLPKTPTNITFGD